ncbi:hypothetical protein BX666DRAFT_1870867 [Dichotomocladium elegans]|nr:hypothetical protein BX666DRAFT_1870867 [Dichotomocladium elegans]
MRGAICGLQAIADWKQVRGFKRSSAITAQLDKQLPYLAQFAEGLLSQDFLSSNPAQRPFLDPRKRKKRTEYAKDKLHWTTGDWVAVVWPDDSRFTLRQY